MPCIFPFPPASIGVRVQYQRLSACYGGKLVSRSAPTDFAVSGWKAAAGAPAGATSPGTAADDINVHARPQAPVYMVVGSAGASFSVNRMPVPPEWDEFATYTYGYRRVPLYAAARR